MASAAAQQTALAGFVRRTLPAMLVAASLGGCDDLTCYETRNDGDLAYKGYIGDRRCYRLSAPRKMTGLWVREFENSAFYEGVSDPASIVRREGAWLNTYELLDGKEIEFKSGNIYRVELTGRTPLLSLSSLVHGGGATNGYDGLVIVDEVNRIELVGPSRPGS